MFGVCEKTGEIGEYMRLNVTEIKKLLTKYEKYIIGQKVLIGYNPYEMNYKTITDLRYKDIQSIFILAEDHYTFSKFSYMEDWVLRDKCDNYICQFDDLIQLIRLEKLNLI